jgi:hypothetical protein
MVQRKKQAAGSQIHDWLHPWLQYHDDPTFVQPAILQVIPHAVREYLGCPYLQHREIDNQSSLKDVCAHRPMCRRTKVVRQPVGEITRWRDKGPGGRTMKNVWEPVPGTRFFTRNGLGLYERLTDQLFLRVDDVDETDVRELGDRFAQAFEARSPVQPAQLVA